MDDFLRVFTHTAKAVRGAAEEALQQHGVRLGQNLLLDALVEGDGQSPGELAAVLGVSTPTVVKMGQRMEAAGLLVRRPDEHDRRLVRLALTRAGRRAQLAATEELRALSTRATAGLSKQQRLQTIKALQEVLSALQPG